MSYTIKFPDLPETGALKGRLGTAELPAEVIAQRVAVWIWDSGMLDENQPRTSIFRMAFSVGDRKNPSLTPQEAKYVLRLIEHAAKSWRAAHEIIDSEEPA